MRKHNGIRPHDLVVLLQIVLLENEYFQMKDLSNKLFISQGEISVSIQRSIYSGLLADDKRSIVRESLFKFILHGLPYTFPAKPGSPTMGLTTGHSAFPLNMYFDDSEVYVWAYSEGQARGLGIEPYYNNQVKAVLDNKELYALLSLTDAIRLGGKREINKSSNLLEGVLIYRKSIYELL